MMDPDGFSWAFAVVGGLLMLAGAPLALEKVAPNRWYGLRTRKTLSSASVWYPINRVLGYDLLAAGAVVAAVALCVLSLGNGLAGSTVALIHVGSLGISVGAALLDGALLLRRL
jgi:uncharacterized membrane protein